MNTIIFQTIRAGVVLGVALFAYANTALAAPTLTPVSVTQIRDTSANLVAQVSNQYRTSTVWFEISGGNINGGPMAVGMRSIYENGFFQWQLQDLNPGTTYYVRAVAMDGGMMTYSPTSSFTTTSPRVTPVVIAYQSNSSPTVGAVTQTKTATPVVKKTTTAPVVAKEGFTNGNSAAVIGAGDGLFPSTLIGWVALLVAILVASIVGHMLYEAPRRRKKVREEEEMMARHEEVAKTA